MANEAARFRKQAEEAREYAAKAISPLDKEAWLRVAEAAGSRPPQLAASFIARASTTLGTPLVSPGFAGLVRWIVVSQ